MFRSAWIFMLGSALIAAILVSQGPRSGEPIAKAQAAELPMLTTVEPQPPLARPAPSMPKAESHPTLAAARRIDRWRHVLLIPPDCGTRGGFDLILHFHGVPGTLEPIFRASALDAVVVITNLGLASGPYEKMFADRASFPQYLDTITRELRTYCHETQPRRVALSSWSAGYGATLRILGHDRNRERIDAVLLADGLHGGLEHRHPRTVRAEALEPVNRFAEQAALGQRLLAITHSSIVTSDYASTTETASFLLNSQGIERELVDVSGPRRTMRQSSTAHRAGFWVAGYAGNDANAHCDHLYAFGKTLLPMLEAHWNRN
ncbi:MAG TPA: hypothetical protein VIV60_30685 [Polyangiaceae bacterium]